LNLELLWIIAFSYFYKKFEYINISLLFKKFYIRKYHINCITIYLTNIYKYREIIKFFTVFRILTFYYPAIKIFTRIKKNYVNFIINNFAELHFDIDVNENIFFYSNDYYFSYVYIANFINQKKNVIELLYNHIKSYKNFSLNHKSIPIVLYNKKTKCARFLNYVTI